MRNAGWQMEGVPRTKEGRRGPSSAQGFLQGVVQEGRRGIYRRGTLGMLEGRRLGGPAPAPHEQPLVAPQFVHLKHDPFRTMVEPHSGQGGASAWVRKTRRSATSKSAP